jgi:hypothetical protein
MKQARYITVLTVFVPHAEALFDMLRYDSCFPRTETDAHKIGRLTGDSVDPDDHIIELVRCAPSNQPPTEGRWRSFGCHILDVRHPDAEATPIEKLRARVLDVNRRISS